ncbi:MAG: biotin/lipoyl-binding protein [Chloroflexi bacterium]|nr:biotin/lipoyl-binding protein [Chloroflexota bacterium]
MFRSVLVANRGEIAVRVCRTLRRMGIRSVVVCSIPDRHSLAVRSAGASVLIEGYSAAESYLDADAVIAAAKAQGCEAIHPGYGFLSERADFAARCAAEGIVFIGPPPAVLRGLGDKAAARQLAVSNGVPVVPGWDGADDDATLVREAAKIGFPVMVKARGGGGGRGMREVFAPAELPEALASARREALSAFGDGGLLLEKLVTNAHHVEVQVLADAHGNVIHLGERDCSVQRRHQKLIEETPSPVVDAALRRELTGAALRLARAIGYVNAGTFEFLVGEPSGDGARPFYFLEVNPRLQVEHPVTELVTGLDLVELQLRVAAGERLPFGQDAIAFSGHAVEFRVNAEDPWDSFRPSAGRVAHAAWPGNTRCDRGYEAGDTVPSQYDSLAGKVLLHGATREDALAQADAALSGVSLAPLRTNVELHREVLRTAAFRAGDASIDWLEGVLPGLLAGAIAPAAAWIAAAASRVAPIRPVMGGPTRCWLSDGHQTRAVDVEFRDSRGGEATVHSAAGVEPANFAVEARHTSGETTVRVGNTAVVVRAGEGDSVACEVDGRVFELVAVPPPPLPRRTHAAVDGVAAITAPLAGTIASVAVGEGDEVAEGQLLLLLEAMKMEHRITAPSAGTVKRLAVAARDVVREGDVLVELA